MVWPLGAAGAVLPFAARRGMEVKGHILHIQTTLVARSFSKQAVFFLVKQRLHRQTGEPPW